MKRFFLIAAGLIFLATASFAQQMPELPNDPEVKVGKLENGMTYYIRHNAKPEQRAEFYLLTAAGAIQEGPGQDGLAHFLEHMCFNGTKNFPGKALLNYLEGIGASFGGNINASTGVERTQYMLNNIPLVREGIIDTCLLIMHDYSHFVLCEAEEIDAERGVILEEKRSRNTASWRMFEQSAPLIYRGTKYSNCNIIGSEETLKTFQRETLVDFYHTWYRPDLQALIVVGDIDVDQIEGKIKTIFADIPAQENPRPKDFIQIPINEEPEAAVLTDPENSGTEVEILWRSEADPKEYNSTAVGLMTSLVKNIISQVMNERFQEISAKPGAPFLDASFGAGNLCESTDIVFGDVSVKEGEALSGFEAMLTEIERMKRYGFNDSEVERAKANLLAGFESAAKRKETRQNREFIQPIMNHFIGNHSYMDPEQKYELVKMILPQLQTEMLNQVAAQIITKENVAVLYTAPEKEGLQHPTEDQLKEIVAKVAEAQIDRGEVEEIPDSFVDPATIKDAKVKSLKDGVYGSTVVTLSNGARVILRPSDLEKDKIGIELYKKGGRSLIADEDLDSFDQNIWNAFMNNCGISSFSGTMTSKMLSGKYVAAQPFISTYTHGISAQSTPKDLETAFQMVYLMFTDPRFDPEEYNKGIDQLGAILPNYKNQPGFILQSELYKTAFDSPRKKNIDESTLENADIKTVERVYRQLFKDAAGLTAVITGDFDKDEIIPLVQKYIGGIRKGKKASDWKYRGDGIVYGSKLNDFRTAMQTPKVTVVQIYSLDKPFSQEARVAYNALEYILDMVYVATLREEEGGTYGASSSASLGHKPYEKAMLQVSFETNEEQADKLRALAVDGLKGLAENGPTEEQFDKTVKNMQKNIAESRITNAFWSNAIQGWEKYGTDNVNAYEAAVNALTPEDVKAAAAEFLNSGNFVELVQRPL